MEKELINLPKNIFITGKSSAGKTTLAETSLSSLKRQSHSNFLIVDGTELLQFGVLYPTFGHSLDERAQRSVHLMRLLRWLNSKDIICLVPIIGQPIEIRNDWKELDSFIEIHLQCDTNVCASRDDKGVYANQSNVVGQSVIYNAPIDPYLNLNSSEYSPDELTRVLMDKLTEDFTE